MLRARLWFAGGSGLAPRLVELRAVGCGPPGPGPHTPFHHTHTAPAGFGVSCQLRFVARLSRVVTGLVVTDVVVAAVSVAVASRWNTHARAQAHTHARARTHTHTHTDDCHISNGPALGTPTASDSFAEDGGEFCHQ
jgi:hypothetical protein